MIKADQLSKACFLLDLMFKKMTPETVDYIPWQSLQKIMLGMFEKTELYADALRAMYSYFASSNEYLSPVFFNQPSFFCFKLLKDYLGLLNKVGAFSEFFRLYCAGLMREESLSALFFGQYYAGHFSFSGDIYSGSVIKADAKEWLSIMLILLSETEVSWYSTFSKCIASFFGRSGGGSSLLQDVCFRRCGDNFKSLFLKFLLQSGSCSRGYIRDMIYHSELLRNGALRESDPATYFNVLKAVQAENFVMTSHFSLGSAQSLFSLLSRWLESSGVCDRSEERLDRIRTWVKRCLSDVVALSGNESLQEFVYKFCLGQVADLCKGFRFNFLSTDPNKAVFSYLDKLTASEVNESEFISGFAKVVGVELIKNAELPMGLPIVSTPAKELLEESIVVAVPVGRTDSVTSMMAMMQQLLARNEMLAQEVRELKQQVGRLIEPEARHESSAESVDEVVSPEFFSPVDERKSHEDRDVRIEGLRDLRSADLMVFKI